jgi:glycosyltransferase involved in cell wall biosynthesis
VTGFYPPQGGGTSVIIKNLISGLPSTEISGIVVQSYENTQSDDINKDVIILELFKLQRLFKHRGLYFVRKLFFRRELSKVRKMIRETGTTHVVGVYPDFEFLQLAYLAAIKESCEFVPYLHDTLVEGLKHTRYAKESVALQSKIFKESRLILVMSEGMQQLYQEKYNLKTYPLKHSYPEKNNNLVIRELKDSIFWGGQVYSINKSSVARVDKARSKIGVKFTIASGDSLEKLHELGISSTGLEKVFYGRKDYLKALNVHQVLILALDWPEESSVHEDELATIFPTKTIEYLNSGRPILVHCPEKYFLARFFRDFKCGIVVSERNTERLSSHLHELMINQDLTNTLVANAKVAAKQFDLDNVVNEFHKILN